MTEIFDGRADNRWAYGDLLYDSVSIKLVDETNGMRITGLKKKQFKNDAQIKLSSMMANSRRNFFLNWWVFISTVVGSIFVFFLSRNIWTEESVHCPYLHRISLCVCDWFFFSLASARFFLFLLSFRWNDRIEWIGTFNRSNITHILTLQTRYMSCSDPSINTN